MRSLTYTIGLVLLATGAAAALAAGCSLDGLVFDIPDAPPAGSGGASSASSSGDPGTQSTTVSSGAGGAGGAGSSAGGGTSSSTASSSSGGPPEDCLNGQDDDGDGDVDCDDSDCGNAGYTCFPATLPNNWFGPGIVYDGNGAVPSCPPEYPDTKITGKTGFSSSPAQCEKCACSNVQIDCVLPPITGYTDAQCAMVGGGNFSPPVANACNAASVMSIMGASAPKPTANISGCDPSGGSVIDIPPPKYTADAITCSASMSPYGACSDGGHCVGPIPAPFHGNQCIYRKSGAPCPAPFTQRHDIVDPASINDTRDCDNCSCTPLNQFGCQVTYDLYTDGNCATNFNSVPADGTCASFAAGIAASGYEANIGYVGTCSPSGGQPVGSVSVGNALTVCCLP